MNSVKLSDWIRERKIFIISIVILGAIVYCYHNIFSTFYQQDEWIGVGDVIAFGATRFMGKYPILDIIFGKGRILGEIFNYIFYRYFPFQVFPFAIFSLVFHFLNAILVYLIALKASKKSFFIAFIASIFYAIAEIHSQAIIWFGASTTALPAATFTFLSIYLLFVYSENKLMKYLFLSQMTAIIAFLYKESSFFLILFLPISYVLINQHKTNLIVLFKKFWPMITYFGFAFAKIAYDYSRISPTAPVSVFSANSIYEKYKISVHFVLYPLLSFSQMFIPQQYMFKFAGFFQKVNYDFLTSNPMALSISQNVTSDVLSIFATFILGILVILSVIFYKKRRNSLIFASLLSMMSFLPFVVLERGSSYLDSRYFIVGTAGGAILLAILCEYVLSLFKKFPKGIEVAGTTIVAGVLMLYGFGNTRLIHRDLLVQTDMANERQSFLKQMTTLYPVLPNKPIVYFSGDNLGFYGLPYVKVPLQQGAGYSVMVYYYKTGVIPVGLIKSDFLWEINQQGYREEGGKGFGYFRDKQDLLKYFNSHQTLSADQIVALFYESGDRKLVDITPEIREYIRTNRGKSL